jgi:ketosteroid isomerase-like protein
MTHPRIPILAAAALLCVANGWAQQAPPAGAANDQWAQPAPSATDTRTADEAAVRAADQAWSQSVATGKVDAMLAPYADEAIVLAPNEPMASDKESRRKLMAELFANPGFSLGWQASKVEAARSGDIAYSLGTYRLTMNDASGKPIHDQGKYATIWRKQPDGSWKVIVDMFNTDLPPPPATGGK